MRVPSRAALATCFSAMLLTWTGGPTAAVAQGGCRLAKGDTPIGKACAEGGLIKAKQTMRAMIKQAKAAGAKFDCADCHIDDNAHEKLSADAREKFARLLAAIDRK